MQAVLGLVPHHRLRAVDHAGRHFLTPVRRQAVHEHGVGIGQGHHLLIDAEVRKGCGPGLVLGFVAHAGPHVGGDQIGTPAGLAWVFEVAQVLALGIADAGIVQRIARRRGDVDLEVQQPCGLHPRVAHVVGVAHPGHGLALDAAAVLHVGEDVGQDLARVVFVGESVDDRHP